MDTHDLIDITAERTGHDPALVQDIATHLYDVTIRALHAGENVTLPGVGVFTAATGRLDFIPANRALDLIHGRTDLTDGKPVACCRRPAMTTKEHATT